MKKLLAILMGMVVCVSVVVAGPPEPLLPISQTAVTNATDTLTVTNTDGFVWGYVYALDLDFSGNATATVDVDVVTSADFGLKRSRTLFSIDNITADGMYFPRELADTTVGVDFTEDQQVLLPLCGEKYSVAVAGCNTNGVIVKATLVICR